MKEFINALARTARTLLSPGKSESASRFEKRPPSPQNALDIFKGSWSSKFPKSFAHLEAGNTPLFEDARILWFLKQIGGAANKRFLEFGPLEGAHTFLICRAGAKEVVAVESNINAYLRCLIMKEVMRLQKGHFLLGEAQGYLDSETSTFDASLACGIIYHLVNPVSFIRGLCQSTQNDIFVWTHYYDPKVINARAELSSKFQTPFETEAHGFRYSTARYNYLNALIWSGFSGGTEQYSHWLFREDLLKCFNHFGFEIRSIAFDHPNHENGPALAFHASRIK